MADWREEPPTRTRELIALNAMIAGRLSSVLELHEREQRWQVDPEAEWSYATRDECLDYDPECEPSSFEVCAECGRIEQADEQRDETIHYLKSIWPCATARAAGVAS